MNALDWLVLLSTLIGIAIYGMWKTRGRRDLDHYLKGDHNSRWIVIGLSVMATQASASTFLSTPGQGYQTGLSFVQNYFGAPIAMIIIAAVFLPIYRRLNVYTAYEYLGKRFDNKTRLLGTFLFLFQRGIQAGITIYAPAIVLSTVFNWQLHLTIIFSGAVVIIYTVKGGSQAVTLTQKYQFVVIIIGMMTAFFVLLQKLPANLTFPNAVAMSGMFHKLKAIDYSVDYRQRYTLWTGLIGGMFLALSYFGTDQTQVQRYIGGASLRDSRMGLMFNAVMKIPMQVFILMLGCMLFVFYQFEKAPLFFDQRAALQIPEKDVKSRETLQQWSRDFDKLQATQRELAHEWMNAKAAGDAEKAANVGKMALDVQSNIEMIRSDAKKLILAANPRAKVNDSDYVFITFILSYLPHGLLGLLITVFFAATLSSKAGELNALASTTIVDLYRHLIYPGASDRHYVIASKCFTIFWGVFAIMFALLANMAENLVEFANIIGSLFYGVILGLFLVAFFAKWVRGTAVFFAGLIAQALVLLLYITTPIGYLWYNVIGTGACVIVAIMLQALLGSEVEPRGFDVLPPSNPT